MKYRSKAELLQAIEREREALEERVTAIPRQRLRETGVWGDGWNVQDLVAHPTEWEQMFLRWYRTGLAGEEPELPAPGFRWNQTPELNREIWRKHRRKSWARVIEESGRSYREIHAVARELPEAALLEPGHYRWTGSKPLATYLGANTASHYRTASKILRRWRRIWKSG